MPSDALFLDSAYVIALAQATDEHHAKAIAMASRLEEQRTPLITTRAVMLEIGAAMARARARAGGIRVIELLQSSPLVEIVPVSEELAARGWNLFRQRQDKEWSWTDCISFAVMSERGLTDALTTDEHSEQAGFTAMLRH